MAQEFSEVSNRNVIRDESSQGPVRTSEHVFAQRFCPEDGDAALEIDDPGQILEVGTATGAQEAADGRNRAGSTAVEGNNNGEPSEKAIMTVQNFVLLCALPFVNICSYMYLYTALPLHFVDQGWPLWQLSLILSLCYVPRMTVSALAVRLGEWTVVPAAALATALSLWVAMEPNNLAAVWVGVFAMSMYVSAPTFRALVFRTFKSHWEQQRGLRWVILSDTLGYSIGPFLGGVLYETGGFATCGWYQVASGACCLVMCLTLSEVRDSFRSFCAHSCWPCATDANPPQDEGNTNDRSNDGEFKDAPAPPSGPVALILVAAFGNIFFYGVEWCLYALYFSLMYDWSGTVIGATQMVGDLLGSVVLALSTLSAVHRVGSIACRVPVVGALLVPPMNLAVLLCGHGALLVLLAQPDFAMALTGQILMGTVYVFAEQAIQEMLLAYSAGSVAVYRRLVLLQYFAFCAGAAACALVGVSLYEAVGFAATFYIAAGCCFAIGVLFGGFFALRFGGTQVGLSGGLAEAEAELRQRWDGRREAGEGERGAEAELSYSVPVGGGEGAGAP